MTLSIQDLREQRAAKAKEARKLLDDNTGDAWTAEISAQVDAVYAEIDRIDSQIQARERQLKLEDELAKPIDKLAGQQGISTDEATALAQRDTKLFESWLRGGVHGLTPEDHQYLRERNVQGAQSVGTDSEGGYTVPRDFAGVLLEKLKAFGGVRSVATVQATESGNAIDWPTVDETANEGELIGENVTATDGDMVFGTTNIGAYKFSSKVVTVPFELLQDTRVDLEGFIVGALSTRIARITNRLFTTGTGTGQPQGVVTASAVGKTGLTGQTTSIIYDDLVDLEHSVDPAYRIMPGVGWMMHDSSLKVLKKLKDSQGRPLWLPGLAVSEPDTILSYRYTINQNVPVMAANAKSVLFGDFGKYLIRDVMAVSLFRFTDSAFTKLGQVGFLAWSRHDGKLIDASNEAIRHYANSAT